MSDTPRTDAKDKRLRDELPSTAYMEMKAFARQLERELAAIHAREGAFRVQREQIRALSAQYLEGSE